MKEKQEFYSSGKLLLCGEYAVLHGATAFALPTKRGQKLAVEFQESNSHYINWKSYDTNNKSWFEAKVLLPYFIVEETNDDLIAIQLVRFLINAKQLNPIFLNQTGEYIVNTYLEFDNNEGLGSSSTLTNNIAQWANINPFSLHFNAFKGSGFDVAVAKEQKPLLYTMNGEQPQIETVNWDKNFTDKLYFVYLNQKQNSRREIAKFNQQLTSTQVAQISRISKLIAINDDYFEFCLLLELAENETALFLDRKTIKQELFSDYKGSIKSLGAWGGDYILATGEDTVNYFNQKGYERVIPFGEMIKN